MKISSIVGNTYNFVKKEIFQTKAKAFSSLKVLSCDTFEKDVSKNNVQNLCDAVKVQKIIDENKILKKIINPDIETYTQEYLEYLSSNIKKYPDLAEVIEKNQKLPTNYVGVYNSMKNASLTKKEIDYIKEKVGENAQINKINQIIPDDCYIKWSTLISQDCPKEKANEIIKTVYDSIKTRQRLDSLHYKDIGNWALKNKTVIDCTSRAIQGGEDFETVLTNAGIGYGGIFKKNIAKRGKSRESCLMSSPYDENTYSEYQYRFDSLIGKERKSPFRDMELTQIMQFKDFTTMLHPQKRFISSALKHAKKSYDEVMKSVQKKVNGEKLNIEELKKAEDNIAQMHYIIANALPFERGTAGVANIMTRSLYNALGIDLPAVKRNVALDLEAFYLTLDKYKENWNMFFELPLS